MAEMKTVHLQENDPRAMFLRAHQARAETLETWAEIQRSQNPITANELAMLKMRRQSLWSRFNTAKDHTKG